MASFYVLLQILQITNIVQHIFIYLLAINLLFLCKDYPCLLCIVLLTIFFAKDIYLFICNSNVFWFLCMGNTSFQIKSCSPIIFMVILLTEMSHFNIVNPIKLLQLTLFIVLFKTHQPFMTNSFYCFV